MSGSGTRELGDPRALVAASLLGEAVRGGAAAAFVWGDETCVVAANEAASTLSGYPLEELLRLSPADVLVESASATYFGARALEQGTSVLRRKDGESVDVGFFSEPTHLGVLGSFTLTLCWPLPPTAATAVAMQRERLQSEAAAVREEARQAQAHARRSRSRRTQPTDISRPQLLCFFGEKSGPSRRVDAFVAQVLQHRRNHDTFRMVCVDPQRYPLLARRFAIERVPTLLVIEDGEVSARVEAPKNRREIEDALARWLR